MTTRCRQFDTFLRIIKALAKRWGNFRLDDTLGSTSGRADIIGGGCLEVRAECQRYHGNTTGERDDKRQCCDDTTDSGCWRTSGGIANCTCANLSVAAGAHHRRGRPVHLSPVRRLFVGRAGGSDAKCRSPSCRWKKASLIRWGGRRAQPSIAPNGAPAVAQRGPGGGRRCRECVRHRHFRALGHFGARLFTSKLTLNDLQQHHERS
jgi:hypothetical protein